MDSRVVELRVHGVGGSTPEALLGVARPEDCERIGGGPISAFFQRRTADGNQRAVEGYVWGGLTTRSTFQPLWLLLLPFTLLNVAGFMARSPRGTALAGILRRAIGLLGYTLTVTWTLWVTTIAVDVVAWSWMGSLESGFLAGWSGAARCGVALALCIAFVVFAAWLADHVTRDFEQIRPPEQLRTPEAGERLLLEDPGFWQQQEWVREQSRVHLALAMGVLTFVTLRTFPVPAEPVPALGVGTLLVPVLAAQLLLLAVIAVASTAETLRLGFLPRDRRRLLGPFGASAFAVILLDASLGGVEVGIANLAGVEGVPGRPEQALADVVGFALVCAAVALLGLLVWHLIVVRMGDAADVPLNTAAVADGLDGLPHDGWRRKVARRRKAAVALSRLGWFLAPPAAAFLILGLVKLAPGGRVPTLAALLAGSVAAAGCQGGALAALAAWLTSACGGLGTNPGWLAQVGTYPIAAAVPLGPGLLLALARNPRTRATVGVLWDVLTFWPRWHHPFAVRSYADRAVPELQYRILRCHRAAGRRVVLSVHSQGTVLAIAALASMRPDDLRGVEVVTFGAPLTALYGRFFPQYFGRPTDFARLCGQVGSWRNLYRLTDYIGREVSGVPGTVLRDPSAGDPGPRSDWLDEQPRIPWTALDGHSGYRREPELRAAVENAARER